MSRKGDSVTTGDVHLRSMAETGPNYWFTVGIPD